MKTLKKALCLVLALVMVVGTMAISAAAADFTDEINDDYAEAVAVLSAIKVIDGYGDDVFGAKDNVTRAQALAFVVRAMLTRSSANKLSASSAAFSDVNQDWQKGVVSFAVAEGMANGWDGKFAPDANVTGYAFEKFVLTALGIEGEYTGNNWENNVFLAANKAGLLDNMEDDFDLSSNVTREQAAQLTYNMINYAPNGKTTQYVVKVGNDLKYRGTDAVTALLMKESNDGATLTTETVNEGSLGATLYNLTDGKSTDPFGRVSTEITNGKTENQKVVYYANKETPVLTYTAAVKNTKIAADLKFDTTSTAKIVEIWEDGVKSTVSVDLKKGASELTYGGNGTLVEVYKTGTNAYKLVIINTYVDKLAATDIVAATKATSTTDAEAAHIKLANNTVGGTDLNYETESFKRNDVVLYTIGTTNGNADTKKVVNAVKAEAVPGKVTATAANYIRVDGVQKNYAKNYADGTLALGNQKTFYYDEYGYIIKADTYNAAVVKTDYIYVVGAKSSQAAGKGTNLFDVKPGDWTVQAKVVDVKTGELKVVDLALATNAAGNSISLATVSGAYDASYALTESDNLLTAGYHAFAMVDGKYAINPQVVNAVSVRVEKNNASVSVAGKYANAKTVLHVITGNKDRIGTSTAFAAVTTTGIANFPSTATTYSALVVADDSNVISDIYVVREAQQSVSSANFAFYAGQGETTDDGTKVSFYSNGEKAEYYKADSGVTSLTDANKGKVFDITITDGKVSVVGDAPKTTVFAGKYVVLLTDTYMVLGESETSTTGTIVYFSANGYTAIDHTSASNPTYAKVELSEGNVVNVYEAGTSATNAGITFVEVIG